MTMIERNDYVDLCANRHKGIDTSNAANVSVAPRKASLRAKIADLIATYGQFGVTCEQVASELGLRYTTASARISELVADKRVVRTRQRRETSSGCHAAVIVSADYAL